MDATSGSPYPPTIAANVIRGEAEILEVVTSALNADVPFEIKMQIAQRALDGLITGNYLGDPNSIDGWNYVNGQWGKYSIKDGVLLETASPELSSELSLRRDIRLDNKLQEAAYDNPDNINASFDSDIFGNNVLVIGHNGVESTFYQGNLKAINDLAEAYGLTIEDMGNLTGNEFIYDRHISTSLAYSVPIEPSDIPYFYKHGDQLRLTTIGQGTPDETPVFAVYNPEADNQYPTDSNPQMPYYLRADKPDDSVSNSDIIQQAVPEGVNPDKIDIVNGQTQQTTTYFGMNSTPQEFFGAYFPEETGLDTSGIEQIADNFNNRTYINNDSTITVDGAVAKVVDVVNMVTDRRPLHNSVNYR